MTIIKVSGLKDPLSIDLIIWFEADINYSQIHFSDGNKYLVCQTLKWFENQLEHFIRINKGGLINPKHVVSFTQMKSREAHIILSNGTKLPISRRRVRKVAEQLSVTSLVITASQTPFLGIRLT